jgi:hypothetical protein
MRVKTELWIKAYIRHRQAAGAFAAVVAHGHDEAGAILIKVARLDGTAAVYGPAPMSLSDPAPGESPADGERRFARMHDAECVTERDADGLISRQRSYDGDIWVIEVEDRAGRTGLDDWLATPRSQF